MGLVLLLWISLISFLLESSLGFTLVDDGRYRATYASQNLQDDGDDVFFSEELSLDEGEGEDLGNPPSSPVYTGYGKPLVLPPRQNIPNTIGQPPSQYYTVKVPPQMVSAGQSFLHTYPSFGQNVPINSVPCEQNLPNTNGLPPSQYYSVNIPPKLAPAGQNVPPTSVPVGQNLPNTNGLPPSQYYSVNIPPKLAPAGQNVPPTSVPVGQNILNAIGQPPSQYYSVTVPPKLGAAGQSIPNTVDKLSSNYPSASAQPPSSPSLNTAEWYGQTNEIDGSAEYASPPKKPSPQFPAKSRSDEDWWSFFFSNFFGDEDFDEMDLEPQNSVIGTEKHWFPQVRFSSITEEPLSTPPPRRQSYIVHTKGNYKRGRVVHTKSVYSPKYEMPIMKYPKGSQASGGSPDNLSNLIKA